MEGPLYCRVETGSKLPGDEATKLPWQRHDKSDTLRLVDSVIAHHIKTMLLQVTPYRLVTCSFETSLPIYETTRTNIPQDSETS